MPRRPIRVAPIVIILFGNFADQNGLTQTLLILAVGFWVVGFWVVGFLVAFAPYFVYSQEAEGLRKQMGERREIILESDPSDAG